MGILVGLVLYLHAFSHIAKSLYRDNCFTVATQINRNFTAAVKYISEFVIKNSDTEILFQ